jgi:hypothetical protein
MFDGMAELEERWTKEAEERRDLRLLAQLRSDPHIDRVLNEISRLSAAARDSDEPDIQYTYNKLWVLARGELKGERDV